MVTITISLEDKVIEALQAKSAQSNLSPNELIAQTLKSYLITEVEDDPLVGLFDLDKEDLAERSEEILQTGIAPHSGWTNKI